MKMKKNELIVEHPNSIEAKFIIEKINNKIETVIKPKPKPTPAPIPPSSQPKKISIELKKSNVLLAFFFYNFFVDILIIIIKKLIISYFI
mgnify:CR=1 FL=1